jgi:hypothetical protein
MNINSTAFKQGYALGLGWAEDYRPGGPYVPGLPCNANEKHRRIRAECIKDRNEFFAGFDAALAS